MFSTRPMVAQRFKVKLPRQPTSVSIYATPLLGQDIFAGVLRICIFAVESTCQYIQVKA